MRTALWETSTGALAALLNSRQPVTKADLYTLTLAGGAVFRWSGCDLQITGAGHTWTIGPGLERSRVRFTVGVDVDTLQLKITDNVGTTINGQALVPFIRAGGLNGARLQLDRAYWGVTDQAPVGALLWFVGRVADIKVDRYGADISIKSDLELLDVMVPRDVYQAGCLNTLFDSACGAVRASYLVSGTASSATDTRRITFSHALSQATGYFELGVVTFTNGANAGIARTVKVHTNGSPGALTVLQPWPFPVASGDAFTISPGCDKTQATCSSKFSNVVHFRGQPYIPVPETVT